MQDTVCALMDLYVKTLFAGDNIVSCLCLSIVYLGCMRVFGQR